MGRISTKLQRLENALNRGDREDTEGMGDNADMADNKS